MNSTALRDAQHLSLRIREEVLKMISRLPNGHVGGSLSVADALAVLYTGHMRYKADDPKWEGRDWLVMSKGHCGPALYATLALKGFFPMEQLATLNTPGTNLPSHCDRKKTPGVDMTTGSLGQGISAAVGIALAQKLRGWKSRCFCIVGDGECNEGQIWEAVQSAVHYQMENMYIFVDWNKKQLDGTLEQVVNPVDLGEKFRAFGCDVRTVKGYDVEDIYQGIQDAAAVPGKPHVIVLDTIKGIGCDFAEKVSFNHYMVMDDAMADAAAAEIERRLAANCYPGGEAR